MTSLLILATLLVLAWLWATWRRGAGPTAEWSYVLLVAAGTCIVMALGLWLR